MSPATVRLKGAEWDGVSKLSAESDQINMRYLTGNMYEGPLDAASYLPHTQGAGTGMMTYADKRTYEGQWQQGQRAGRGRLDWPNGVSYEGRWDEGWWCGLGKYTYADGSVYEGEFDGCINGLGMQWDREDKLTHCGHWMFSRLVELRPVPRSKLLFGSKLSDAAKLADLFLPDGTYYKGGVKDGWPDDGSKYLPEGRECANGTWQRGKLQGRGWAELYGY